MVVRTRHTNHRVARTTASTVLRTHTVGRRVSIPHRLSNNTVVLHLSNNTAVLHLNSSTVRPSLTRLRANNSTVLLNHSKDTKFPVSSNTVLHLHTVVNKVAHLHTVANMADRRLNTKLLEVMLHPDLKASKALEVSPLEDMDLTKQKK